MSPVAIQSTSLNHPLNMSTSTPTAAVPTYDHKAGKIVIFNGDNFADWERTCEAALIMAEGWDFVTGAEDPARANTVDGRRRRGEANKIIFNSIGDDRQEEMRTMMKEYDIRGIWEGMKRFNKANDEVYISRLRREFYSTTFDPAKMRISEFLHALNRYKINLASTPRPLTNDDIREQLLLVLPSDVI